MDRRKTMLKNKIVVHYEEGKLFKGVTNNFSPNKNAFHLVLMNEPPDSKPLELTITGIKGLFFVKDYFGNPDYREKKEFDPSRPIVGRKIKIFFKDGELMVGTTIGYQKDRQGFFVVPADPDSNNERCFVVASSTLEVSLI
jgi:hypothetical protein